MRANGYERPEFELTRPNGTSDFLFLHFKSRGILRLGGTGEACASTEYTEGDCVLLQPGFPHYFRPVDVPLCHDWIHFLVSDAEGFLHSGIPFNTLLKPQQAQYLAEITEKMNLEWINRESGYENILSSYMQILCTVLIRTQKAPVLSRYLQERKKEFFRFRQNLYSGAASLASVEEAAAALNLSRTRFSQLYTDFFGISPKKDFQRARLLRAKQLLCDTDSVLQDIAEQCGYGGEFQLIRDFKKQTGLTPGKYRG